MAEDVRRITRSQTVALVLGVSAIFAVALVFAIGGEVGIGSEGVAPRHTRPAPLGAGAAAIIGAFIGGTSAAVTSYLADRRRFKREDRYRDHSDRRQVYSEFVSRWTQYEEAKQRAPQGLQGLQEFDVAYLQLLRTFNALSLIAPEEVRAAADEVLKEKPGAPGRFWQAARKDLGVPD